jgi:hypothetical protein
MVFRLPRYGPRPMAPWFVLGLAVAALVLSGASLPHVHALDHPGLHNQEHDLGYLAAFGNAGPLPGTFAVAGLAVVLVLGRLPKADQPSGAPGRHADFRAPPVR